MISLLMTLSAYATCSSKTSCDSSTAEDRHFFVNLYYRFEVAEVFFLDDVERGQVLHEQDLEEQAGDGQTAGYEVAVQT